MFCFLEVPENKELLEKGVTLVNDHYFNLLLTVHLQVPKVEEEGLKKLSLTSRKDGLIKAMKLSTKPFNISLFTEFLKNIETVNSMDPNHELLKESQEPCVVPSVKNGLSNHYGC